MNGNFWKAVGAIVALLTIAVSFGYNLNRINEVETDVDRNRYRLSVYEDKMVTNKQFEEFRRWLEAELNHLKKEIK